MMHDIMMAERIDEDTPKSLIANSVFGKEDVVFECVCGRKTFIPWVTSSVACECGAVTRKVINYHTDMVYLMTTYYLNGVLHYGNSFDWVVHNYAG